MLWSGRGHRAVMNNDKNGLGSNRSKGNDCMFTIWRTVDGVKYCFELSGHELFEAFSYQEHLFDMQDVEDMVDSYAEDYGVPLDVAHAMIDSMATEMRRNIDKYDMSWQSARDDAIVSALNDYSGRKENAFEC